MDELGRFTEQILSVVCRIETRLPYGHGGGGHRRPTARPSLTGDELCIAVRQLVSFYNVQVRSNKTCP
jgi:hypothetical protein